MTAAPQSVPCEPGTELLQLVHHILVLDAFLAGPLDCERQAEITRNFIDDALAALGMQPLAELGIFPAADERAPGWSFVQAITTSHISAHYFERPGRLPHIRLDAYSCESIDRNVLIRLCHEHFRLADWRATFIDRRIDREDDRTVIDLTGFGNQTSSEHLLSTANAQEASLRQSALA